MLKTLRVGWRQLLADPGYSAVVLLGLAVAVACCILAMQVTVNNVMPDPDIHDPARVVNLEFRGNDSNKEDNWFDQAPFVLADALREHHAPVSVVARSLDGHAYVVHAGARQGRLQFEFADRGLIDIFDLRATAGDLRAAFDRPDGIALNAYAARLLFPGGDALGRTVEVKGHALTVVALVPDRWHGEEQAMDAFVGFDSVINHVDTETRTSWGSIQGKVFARLADGASAEDVGRAAQALYEASPAMRHPAVGATADKSPVVRAMPLDRQYLDGGRDGGSRRRQFLALAGGAALVLVLAVANYVNLTSVRTLARAREIAVRKTLGAGPWRLTAQFMAESTLAAGVATAVGLLVAWWVAPAVGHLMYLRLADDLLAPGRLAGLAAFALLLGVLTGLYPARIALAVPCGAALAGRTHDEGRVGRGLRRAMTALQFVVALFVSAMAGTMLWQNAYVAALPHGIRTTGLLALDVPDGFSGRSDAINAAFGEALSHEPGVRKTAWTMDVPGRGQAWTGLQLVRAGRPAPVPVSALTVGNDFFPVFDVPLVAGQLRLPPAPPPAASSGVPAGPRPERLLVVDAATSRALGFARPQDAVDQLLAEGDPDSPGPRDAYRIVAVSADVRMEHAHEPVRLHAFGLSRRPQESIVLEGASMAQLQRAVDRTWPRFFPEDTAETSTIEEALGMPYIQERRVTQMTLVTTAIALLLSAFGVYALAAYTVRRSAREIVVRKLYGAGRGRIARLMAREFAPLLVAAAVLGLPLAGWLSQSWLDSFTERSPTILWALPAALLALLATTALAALRHARLAMAMRPARALRD